MHVVKFKQSKTFECSYKTKKDFFFPFSFPFPFKSRAGFHIVAKNRSFYGLINTLFGFSAGLG